MLGVASLGDWLGLLATATFASAQVTGSAAKGVAFGSVIAVRLLPALVLGPLAGVLADRFDRRYTMVVCDLLRFPLFASIPTVALLSENAAVTVGWAAIATFLVEAITMIWTPAKDASIPNLIPRARLEAANQLTLITTYGITPVLAAISLAGLSQLYQSAVSNGVDLPTSTASSVALYFLALSRLATAVVVFFGIKEIGGRESRGDGADQGVLRQFVDGWKYVARTPLVRGLVLGILGAFACGGLVVGTAQFYALSLGGGDSTFSLLFGLIFVGLGLGIAFGPRLVGALSRRRWFGFSIMLAASSVGLLALAPHLSIAAAVTLLVGAGAGMAFLSGTTLLGGEVEDDVRGRVFAFVQTAVRVVLMLAIALSGVLVGVGGSREFHIAGLAFPISSTRLLLLVAGIAGTFAGMWALRQMDDKPGVPLFRDLWSSMRGRPLEMPEGHTKGGTFIVFEGGEGAGKSTQLELLAEKLRGLGHDVVVTREPGATPVGAGIRKLVLDRESADDAPIGPRAEALLYAADRAHHVASLVRPALARGAVVISDRYVDSSLAYQGAGRALAAEDVAWLSRWATNGLKPDLTIVLDVDPTTGLSRVADRGAGHDRLESESLRFHERVRHAFLDLAAAEPARYLVVDAAEPVETITELIAERVTELLPPPLEGPFLTPPSDAELSSIVDSELERR
ncbi:dTMP kinase [Allocatelliglobosispora scoriae]|uniref:dTMP kinase n=1 Tax=Allocatelliglobosispora scoriae TaxID=643052 RepID=UPI0028AAF89D|nr:dTMP kinase [Allocatelliglobosispora scoriae]